MNKKKAIIVLTAVGLLGTTAVVGAKGMTDKISGFLRKDVAVTINGEATSLHPVFIDGKAYLPIRDAAPSLGYNLEYKNNRIVLSEAGEEAPDYMRMTGVIVSVQATDNGQYRVEVLGHGSQSWVILYVDKDTKLTGADDKALAAKDLKAGQQIVAEFGPIMTMSFPGQSHAASLKVQSETLIKESAIQSVAKTDDGWQVKFADEKGETTIVLNAGKETAVMDAQGQPVKWEDLKAGQKVRAYYGPIMTKSLPPISPLHYLVVLNSQSSLAPAEEKEFRDLAWAQISADEKPHVTTKQDEAKVEVVAAKDAPVFGGTDAQKQLFEVLKLAGDNVVTVTYNTDRDELIGPLVIVYDANTKTHLGYYIRK